MRPDRWNRCVEPALPAGAVAKWAPVVDPEPAGAVAKWAPVVDPEPASRWEEQAWQA